MANRHDPSADADRESLITLHEVAATFYRDCLGHGLMQNLDVTDKGDGTYRVIAGGRRLEAIHLLRSEGKLPEDFAVPCQVVTKEHALEMSLAENTVRLAMHPTRELLNLSSSSLLIHPRLIRPVSALLNAAASHPSRTASRVPTP